MYTYQSSLPAPTVKTNPNILELNGDQFIRKIKQGELVYNELSNGNADVYGRNRKGSLCHVPLLEQGAASVTVFIW